METIFLILQILFFAWILFLPQFLGILVHYRMKRFPRLAYLLGFLLTTILSFFLLLAIFPKPTQEETGGCGLWVMSMAIFVLFFTSLQIIGSLFAQLWVRARKILIQARIS